MARTVTDAAILLGALAGPDPADLATASIPAGMPQDFTRSLDPKALRGARLGIAREYSEFHPAVKRAFESHLALLKSLGAELIDPVELPNGGDRDRAENEILHYEFKAGINAYLATLGPAAPVRTLKDLIVFNETHRDVELRWFGQEEFLRSEARGPLTDPAYLQALAVARRVARDEGIDGVMLKHNLDALIAPTTGPASLTDWVLGDYGSGGSTSPAAVAGYPSVTVPAGQILGLPFGLSFFGRAWTEARLLSLAFAFEQATHFRRPPKFLATIGVEL
jgi:amidase